jgi:hypothetical protein
MFDGDGSESLELQAFKIAQNATLYKGSYPCPTCGVIMNPTEYMYSVLGVCPPCGERRKQERIKRKLSH